MKSLKSEKITLVLSFAIHAGIAGLLTIGAKERLLIGSIKGSAPAATVSFEVISQPEVMPKPKVKSAKLFDGPSEVIVKKKKEMKPKKVVSQKIASRAKAKVTREGADKPVGLVGFDLRNIKGNLPPALSAYFKELRTEIERKKRYPKIAKRLRQSGRVILRFEIAKEGIIQNVTVSEPSRYRTLNESARKLVSNLKGKYPLPDMIEQPRIEVKLPVNYQL